MVKLVFRGYNLPEGRASLTRDAAAGGVDHNVQCPTCARNDDANSAPVL